MDFIYQLGCATASVMVFIYVEPLVARMGSDTRLLLRVASVSLLVGAIGRLGMIVFIDYIPSAPETFFALGAAALVAADRDRVYLRAVFRHRRFNHYR